MLRLLIAGIIRILRTPRTLRTPRAQRRLGAVGVAVGAAGGGHLLADAAVGEEVSFLALH